MIEKTPGNDKFLSELKTAIIGNSRAWFGEHAEKILIESKSLRRYSFLFRVTVSFPNLPDLRLVIKIPRMPWMESLEEVIPNEKLKNEAKLESKILGRIYQRIQESGLDTLAAIRVYGHLPDFCAIVMEDLQFELLKNSISGLKFPFMSDQKWQSFLEKLGQSANWLRLFHESNQIETDTGLHFTEFLNDAGIAFQRLESVSGLDLTEIKDQLNQIYETVEDQPVQQAYLHNDFHLGNIFATKAGKIGSFDPNWEATGSNLVDIARILIDLETRRVQVLTFGLFLGKQRNDEFKKTFLKEYFQAVSIEEKLVNLFCILELLKKWRVNEDYFASYKMKGKKLIMALLRNWSRVYFKYLIRQYSRV